MALRLVEIFLPYAAQDKLFEVLSPFASTTIVQQEIEEGQFHLKILVQSDRTQALLDQLEAAFHHHHEYSDTFRILITPVHATIPRLEQEESEAENTQEKLKYGRVNREELYANVQQAGQPTWLFMTMVVFSSIVAAIGLLRNNVAVVIGAMVIAPLLGPNVALSLASALGDKDLGKSARRANIAGILIPLLIAVVVGLIFECGPNCTEILSRTEINLSDIILALVAGAVAALSFTTDMAGAIIGVMVAVALLPPLVSSGILLGDGQFKLAFEAGLLFLTNLICVNLAGVVTFLIQGIQPIWWWEKETARKATRRALITWVVCLALLVLSILASQLGWLDKFQQALQ